jgi:uncharacterized protein YdcH (DUF465 family)
MLDDGLCKCGCGQKTTISQQKEKRFGYEKGQPKKYISGHNQKLPYAFVLEDRGYSSPCWIWIRGLSRVGGYGLWGNATKKVIGRSRYAHRYFYDLIFGPVQKGLQLHHRCRVTYCVNPNHLEPLTPAQHKRKDPNTKLTLEQIDEILELRRSKMQLKDIAAKYKIAVEYAGFVCRQGKVWTNARLTETQKQEILNLRRNKMKMKDIAFRCGILISYAEAVCREGKVWVTK